MTMETITLVQEYWDCACEKKWIKPKSQPECPVCGTHHEEQADSRLNEVLEEIVLDPDEILTLDINGQTYSTAVKDLDNLTVLANIKEN